jgi:YD repeat-containing protein
MVMSYDAASRLATLTQGSTVTSFVYDPIGNMTLESQLGVGAPQTAYLYDNENRLKKVTNPDGAFSTYTYDGTGLRRTRQQPTGGVHTQIWDGTNYLNGMMVGEIRGGVATGYVPEF